MVYKGNVDHSKDCVAGCLICILDRLSLKVITRAVSYLEVAYYVDESSVSGDVNQVQIVRQRGTRNSRWRRGYGNDLGGGDTVGLLQ